jgi:hypothetical protein
LAATISRSSSADRGHARIIQAAPFKPNRIGCYHRGPVDIKPQSAWLTVEQAGCLTTCRNGVAGALKRFRVSGHKRGADLALATHHSAGCGPPSCVRHLMFKFWELFAINCCGTHLCSRQPQLRFRRMQRFGLGESNARRREYLEQPLELIAVADFGIGTRRKRRAAIRTMPEPAAGESVITTEGGAARIDVRPSRNTAPALENSTVIRL